MSNNTTFRSPNPVKPVQACVLLLIGILLMLAFIDFHPQQTRLVSTAINTSEVNENLVGEFGAYTTFYSIRYIGFAYWLLPFCFIWSAYILVRPQTRLLNKRRLLAMTTLLISSIGLLEFVQQHFMSAETFLQFSDNKYSGGLGGIFGTYIFYYCIEPIFGEIGGALILSTIFLLSLIGTLTRSPSLNAALEREIQKYGYFRVMVVNKIKRFFCIFFKCIKILISLIIKLLRLILRLKRPNSTNIDNTSGDVARERSKPIKKEPSKLKIIEPNIQQSTITNRQEWQPNKVDGNYVFPTIDLLQQSQISKDNADDHAAISQQLVSTLAEFGIAVIPGEVHTGPVITRYEITPAPGVRVEKILNLDKNIALSLRAQSVRILAPVPGKGCVGIELPNKLPQMVCLREILESVEWARMKADIPIVLGRGTTGEPMLNDLAKMPHLLIAGSTGSGKTVCINAIIASLVYHASPSDLRFIMVDPKIVEMQVFNDLPHMLIPVVTDPKKVPNALKWLISEMERRYKIFATAGVRNIAGFNAKIMRDADERARARELELSLSPEERSAIDNIADTGEHVEVPKTKMPYIVCIIDELADLMLVAPADIETCVARLAQLARAAGIHLILATQRPSVNVITGIIKANLPSRIAFKVASKVDSRTILDVGGAEALLGRGDMLFQPPGASGLLRAQGALVSDEEINNIVRFLHEKNGAPKYMMDVHAQIEQLGEEDDEFGEDWDDDMIPKALEVLRNSDRASTSLLQRRLKIGYNRAARIMETLEAKGLVSLDRSQRDQGD
ncbi:MAG: DNA translocase FtsK 4TM domain-containing protein [Opitutales bacterium]|nr:DNA translocase FtsK 4TM domain-containing protein [Opitutales bacterium]